MEQIAVVISLALSGWSTKPARPPPSSCFPSLANSLCAGDYDSRLGVNLFGPSDRCTAWRFNPCMPELRFSDSCGLNSLLLELCHLLVDTLNLCCVVPEIFSLSLRSVDFGWRCNCVCVGVWFVCITSEHEHFMGSLSGHWSPPPLKQDRRHYKSLIWEYGSCVSPFRHAGRFNSLPTIYFQ